MDFWRFKPYVSVAQRRANAKREMMRLSKQGKPVAPVEITGRAIATSFWGRAWCDNLEAYSDFANRLPRGRTYVRNGSVIDLQVEAGHVSAMVSGSSIYRIEIDLAPLPPATWQEVKKQCGGQVGSLVDLLRGKLSKDVMAIVTARDNGLFPKPKEIRMSCSCPDYAFLCKHLAAVLYGIGARLDKQPELLFSLRGVDHLELIAAVGDKVAAPSSTSGKKTIADTALAELFGIEIEPGGQAKAARRPRHRTIQPSLKVPAKPGKTSKKRPSETTTVADSGSSASNVTVIDAKATAVPKARRSSGRKATTGAVKQRGKLPSSKTQSILNKQKPPGRKKK